MQRNTVALPWPTNLRRMTCVINTHCVINLPAPSPGVFPQRRALATYVRRLYYPYLLHEPELQAAEGGALAAGACRTERWAGGGGRTGHRCRAASCLQRSQPSASNRPCQLSLQCGRTMMRRWRPPPLRASAPAGRWWCAACTTCPLCWLGWSGCVSRQVGKGGRPCMPHTLLCCVVRAGWASSLTLSRPVPFLLPCDSCPAAALPARRRPVGPEPRHAARGADGRGRGGAGAQRSRPQDLAPAGCGGICTLWCALGGWGL